MIKEHNLARVQEDEDTAISLGFLLAKPLYALGTDVLPIGVKNYKTSRKEYEDLPDVEEASNSFYKVIKDEQRIDEELLIPETYMLFDGSLSVYQDSGRELNFIPTQWALRQLIERTTPNKNAVKKAAQFISDEACPSALRADNANYYLSRAFNTTTNKENTAIYRSRILSSSTINNLPKEIDAQSYRELYAVVSKRFNRDCDVDNIVKIINKKVEESKVPARAEVIYDTHRFRMGVFYHSDVETPVVGELFKAGFIINSADDGSMAIDVTAVVRRNLCLNFFILDDSTQTVSISHLRTNLYDDVSNAIDVAMSKVSTFGKKWAEASKERIIDTIYNDIEPEKIFTELVKQGYVKVSGTSKTDLICNLVTAWNKEPGYQKTNILNAITRASHESTWSSPWTGVELEEQAGNLLYNKLFLNFRNSDDVKSENWYTPIND